MVSVETLVALQGPQPPRPAAEMWCGDQRATGCRRIGPSTYAVFVGDVWVGNVSAASDFMMTSMDGFGLPFV